MSGRLNKSQTKFVPKRRPGPSSGSFNRAPSATPSAVGGTPRVQAAVLPAVGEDLELDGAAPSAAQETFAAPAAPIAAVATVKQTAAAGAFSGPSATAPTRAASPARAPSPFSAPERRASVTPAFEGPSSAKGPPLSPASPPRAASPGRPFFAPSSPPQPQQKKVPAPPSPALQSAQPLPAAQSLALPPSSTSSPPPPAPAATATQITAFVAPPADFVPSPTLQSSTLFDAPAASAQPPAAKQKGRPLPPRSKPKKKDATQSQPSTIAESTAEPVASSSAAHPTTGLDAASSAHNLQEQRPAATGLFAATEGGEAGDMQHGANLLEFLKGTGGVASPPAADEEEPAPTRKGRAAKGKQKARPHVAIVHQATQEDDMSEDSDDADGRARASKRRAKAAKGAKKAVPNFLLPSSDSDSSESSGPDEEGFIPASEKAKAKAKRKKAKAAATRKRLKEIAEAAADAAVPSATGGSGIAPTASTSAQPPPPAKKRGRPRKTPAPDAEQPKKKQKKTQEPAAAAASNEQVPAATSGEEPAAAAGGGDVEMDDARPDEDEGESGSEGSEELDENGVPVKLVRRGRKQPEDLVVDPLQTTMAEIATGHDRVQGRISTRYHALLSKKEERRTSLAAKRRRMRDRTKRRKLGQDVDSDDEEAAARRAEAKEDSAVVQAEQEQNRLLQERRQALLRDVEAGIVPHDDAADDPTQGNADAGPSGQRNGGEDSDEEEEEEDGGGFKESQYAPQMRLVNGQLVLDEASLEVDRSKNAGKNTGVARELIEETARDRMVNSATWRKKPRSAVWSKHETDMFYEYLSQFGTDFEMISRLFPSRTRSQIRSKWNKEERVDPNRITEALKRKKPIDMEMYAASTGLCLDGPIPEDPLAAVMKLREEEEKEGGSLHPATIKKKRKEAAVARASEAPANTAPQAAAAQQQQDDDDDEDEDDDLEQEVARRKAEDAEIARAEAEAAAAGR